MKNFEICFMTKCFILVSLFVFGLSSQASAQEALKTEDLLELSIEEILDTTVVTATKTEKKLEDAPGSVTVISKEEMRRRDIKTVDEALSELAGVFVKRNKGLMDSNASLKPRGFKDSQYLLVLLDGQPLNTGYSGGVAWSALPVENIERIEVIRGAASALYGGNAMGGVANIITRTSEKTELTATGGYGTHDARRYRFRLGHRFMDKFSMNLGYEEESTDGYETALVTRTIKSGQGTASGGYLMNDKYGEPKKWVVGDRGENSAERNSYDVKASFDFSDTGNLSLTGISTHHEYAYGPPNTYMGTFSGDAVAGPDTKAGFSPNDFIHTGIGENDTDIYTLSFKESFGPVQLHAQAGLTTSDRIYTTESGGSEKSFDDSPGSLTDIETETRFSEIHVNIPMGAKHILLAGASFRTDEADINQYDVPYYQSFSGKSSSKLHSGGKDEIWAVFLEDEWNLTETLALYIGGRFDSWKVYDGSSGVPGSEEAYKTNTDSQFNPRAALVWKAFPDTIFRASAGHAFRPPNLYELYRTHSTRTTTYQSNPNLDPETVWTYEAGIDQYFFNRKTRVSMTGYRNDIKDLIYYKEDAVAKTKTRTNAGQARTYGLEIEASQEIYSWLRLRGNFTYTDAEITENELDPESKGKQLADVPETTWNIGLDAQHKWFRGSLVGRYFSKIFTDADNRDTEEGVYLSYEPAFYLDGKITFTPYKWAELSFSVDNILDEEYFEYYKQDGRTFSCELTFRY